MTRVLFVTVDAGGNLPPALGIAAEIERRGGSARFLGHEAQRERIESSGHQFLPYRRGRGYDPIAPRRTLDGLLEFTALVADPGIAEDVLEAARSERTDVVVIDCLLYRATTTASAAGLPVAHLVHTFSSYLTSMARGPVGLVAGLRGADARAALAAPGLAIVTSPEGFDSGTPRASARHVGFVWQGEPVAARPRTRPLVLVSLSTTSFPGQLRAIQRAVDALAGIEADVVVTTGPSIDPSSIAAAPNSKIRQWVDHGALLPETSLVIGHGGHSTVGRALSHGVPMLILPMHPLLDQPAVGRAVERAGAGRMLPKGASVARIRATVASMLADPGHRAAAGALGESIRRRDGAMEAADLLDAFR